MLLERGWVVIGGRRQESPPTACASGCCDANGVEGTGGGRGSWQPGPPRGPSPLLVPKWFPVCAGAEEAADGVRRWGWRGLPGDVAAAAPLAGSNARRSLMECTRWLTCPGMQTCDSTPSALSPASQPCPHDSELRNPRGRHDAAASLCCVQAALKRRLQFIECLK